MIERRATAATSGEDSVATALLDKVVAEVNRIHSQKGMELARALGQFLLKSFFGGSIETFKARAAKHATFRALARREDLQVSYATLWYSIAVIEQIEQLPEFVSSQLSFSHHRLLLPVEDVKEKLSLARRVIDEKLTTRQLELLIRRRDGDLVTSRTGRPRIPEYRKGVNRVRAALETAVSDGLNTANIPRIPRDEAARLLIDLRQQLDTLRGLVEQFENRLALAEPTDEAPLPLTSASAFDADDLSEEDDEDDGSDQSGTSNSGVTNTGWAS
jgi:hypothetical protein